MDLCLDLRVECLDLDLDLGLKCLLTTLISGVVVILTFDLKIQSFHFCPQEHQSCKFREISSEVYDISCLPDRRTQGPSGIQPENVHIIENAFAVWWGMHNKYTTGQQVIHLRVAMLEAQTTAQSLF